MSKDGTVSSNQKSVPGMPVVITSERDILGTLNRLYRLDYIKHNAIHSVILMLPGDINIDSAVTIAKRYCRVKAWTFSWLERAITELKEETDV